MPVCPWCERRVWLWRANFYGGSCARCWRAEADGRDSIERRADGTLTGPRLEGAWRSDAERTVGEWRERRPMTDEQAARLGQVFGHLRVTFTGQHIAYDFLPSSPIGGPGWVATSTAGRFVVVARDERSVVFLGPEPGSDVPVLTLARFMSANTYWVHTDLAPTREYFTRER